MPRDLFFQTGDPIKELAKLSKKQLKAFQRVSAGVLNDQAFTTRSGHQETLRKDNIIRTPSLLKKGTRVVMAKATDPIAKQRSQAGSVEVARHDAWAAIDQGLSTRATMFNDEGRAGGSETGRGKAMAKAGNTTRTQPIDFRLKKAGDQRVVEYLQAIQSDKKLRRRPFFLPRQYKKMQRGVYKFKGGRVGVFKSEGRKHGKTLVNAQIVRLSKPAARFKPKKTRWNERTVRREIDDRMLAKSWKRQMNRELRKVKAALK